MTSALLAVLAPVVIVASTYLVAGGVDAAALLAAVLVALVSATVLTGPRLRRLVARLRTTVLPHDVPRAPAEGVFSLPTEPGIPGVPRTRAPSLPARAA